MLNLDSDREVLAATIYGEARGEIPLGRFGVAWVVHNRVLAAQAHPRPQFGTGNYRSACLAKYQFSCWNINDPNRPALLALDCAHPGPVLAECLLVADAVLGGISAADPTHGAKWYKVTSLPWPHDWGKPVPALAVIGHHSFYNLAE